MTRQREFGSSGNPVAPGRIAILIASLRIGGAERFALRLLGALNDRGVDAILLVLDGNHEMPLAVGESKPPWWADRVFHLTQSDVYWSTPRKVLHLPRVWIRLQQALRRHRVHTLISLMERANAFSLASLGGVRRILSVRSHPTEAFARKDALKRLLVTGSYNALIGRADCIVFNSHEAEATFPWRPRPGRSTHAVIHNFCDLEHLREVAGAPVSSDTPAGAALAAGAVVACGRLSREKGHWQLIRAFSVLLQTQPDARLVILGEGPMEEPLRELVHARGLANQVQLAGFAANPFSWLARARLVVQSSLWEGFPNTLLEAMALGRPVVSTDCSSGPRELLAPGTPVQIKTREVEQAPFGILTPPLEDQLLPAEAPLSTGEAMLARGMATVLGDATLSRHLGRAAQQRAREFAPEKLMGQWLALASNQAGGPGGAE